MTALKLRPFAFSCCLFLFSTLISVYFSLTVKTILFSFFLLLFIFLLIKRNFKFVTFFVLPPLLVSSLISIINFDINYNNIQTYVDKECYIDFIPIEEHYVSDTYSIYTVKVTSVNNDRSNFKATITFEGTIDTPLYYSYSAKVMFSQNNTYETDNRISNLSNGIFISANVTDKITDNKTLVKLFPNYYFNKLNNTLSSVFDRHIKGEENNLSQALILGNKSKLSPHTKYNFQKLGLSHMLAVSGLHLSILISTLDLIIDKLSINKKKKYVLMIFLTFAYAGLTGFSSSVKRAALMLIIYYLTFLIAKSNDSITSLCTSVALIVFFSPCSVFDIGLWLSFLSTYGILAVAIPVTQKSIDNQNNEEKHSLLKTTFKKLWSMLLFGIVPVLFSIPAIWISYGEIAVLSPISNILFTPFLLAIMYTCPVFLCLSFIPPLAHSVSLIPYLSAKLMLTLAELLSDFSPVISINYSFSKYIIIFLVVTLFIISLTNPKNKSVYFIPFIVSILIFSICIYVHFTNTKDTQKAIYSTSYSGQSFLIISNRKTLLLDISGGNTQNALLAELHLNNNHLTQLNGYIITDYTNRYLKSIERLSAVTDIETLYLPTTYGQYDEVIKQQIISLANEYKIDIVPYDNLIAFNGVDIQVENLSKSAEYKPDSIAVTLSANNSSYVYFSYGFDSTVYGKGYATKLFNTQNNYIFGTYGIKCDPARLSLFFKDNVSLFFPSKEIFEHYKTTLPNTKNIIFLKNGYELPLN